MCQGRRKNTVTTTTAMITFHDYFLTKAPPKTSFRFIIVFIAISILLLGISLIPQVVMFETEFTSNSDDSNVSTVSIVDSLEVTQVTQILWGTWKACYNDATSTDSSKICTGTDWISNPYNFTIMIQNGNFEANPPVSVQDWWFHVLFLQFIGVIFAILIGLVVIFRYCCLERNRSKRIDATGKNSNLKDGRICNLTSVLAAFLFVWVTIVVIGNGVVLGQIHKEIKSLETGTSISVITKAAPGFWLPVAADGFTFLTFILVACYIRSKYNKHRDVTTTVIQTSQLMEA